MTKVLPLLLTPVALALAAQARPRTSLHNGRPSRSPRARDDHSDP